MSFLPEIASRSYQPDLSEEPDKLEVAEIWPSDNSSKLQKTQIPDANVGLWSAKSSSDGTEAPALLRLVCVQIHRDRHPWVLNTRKSILDTVLKNFELEEAYRYTFIYPASFALMPVRQTEDSDTLAFSLGFGEKFGMAWKHDARSERTECVVWCDDWTYEEIWRVMDETKEWPQHPLLLALVASISLSYGLDNNLVTKDDTITAVENRTRYHGFASTNMLIAHGDYTTLSQRMSACAGILALVECHHKIHTEFLGDISLYSQRYYVRDDQRSKRIRSEVEDCLETLKRKSKMQKIELDYLTRRVEIQLTALFNLISQQETKVGIAVAEDSRTLASASKEDSTAMKTIAAVTIVFLPGTSVAALFAMPLFEWNAVGDNKIVSKRFWIYWAVTIPLTFLTLLFWVLWTKRQARMHRSSEKKAREDLRSDIEGQRVNGEEKKEV